MFQLHSEVIILPLLLATTVENWLWYMNFVRGIYQSNAAFYLGDIEPEQNDNNNNKVASWSTRRKKIEKKDENIKNVLQSIHFSKDIII